MPDWYVLAQYEKKTAAAPVTEFLEGTLYFPICQIGYTSSLEPEMLSIS
jgi:hypothetical protein